MDDVQVVPSIDVVVSAVLLLLFFALLVAWGIKESSTAAMIIMVMHLFTLTSLCLSGYVPRAGETPLPRSLTLKRLYTYLSDTMVVISFPCPCQYHLHHS